jgi:iron(III) transport system substrate-binding protein
MLSSNGEVRRRVAAGDFAIGLTDSDDVNVALKDGAPVGFVLPDQEGMGTLLVPNAVVLIAGARNPDNAKKFIDFLLSPESERWLAESDAAQIPLRTGIPAPKMFPNKSGLAEIRLMNVEYAALATRLEELSRGFLNEWVEQQNNLPQRRGAGN